MLQAHLSRHARCQELGLSQDICHPPTSIREVTSRPGVEAHWYVGIYKKKTVKIMSFGSFKFAS